MMSHGQRRQRSTRGMAVLLQVLLLAVITTTAHSTEGEESDFRFISYKGKSTSQQHSARVHKWAGKPSHDQLENRWRCWMAYAMGVSDNDEIYCVRSGMRQGNSYAKWMVTIIWVVLLFLFSGSAVLVRINISSVRVFLLFSWIRRCTTITLSTCASR